MFTLPEENEDLIVEADVGFVMPNKVKANFIVSFKYFDIPSHKQLLDDTGKTEQEKRRLKLYTKLRNAEDKSEEEMVELLDEQFDSELDDCDLELLKEAIINIEGIKDPKGKVIEYNEEVLERILRLKQPRIALLEKFTEIHTDEGRKRARRKN